jgi:hypothetical protein
MVGMQVMMIIIIGLTIAAAIVMTTVLHGTH